MTCSQPSSVRQPILILGVHQATDAYPNTRYVIEELHRAFNAEEISFKGDMSIGHFHGGVRRPRALGRLVVGHLNVFLRYLLGVRWPTAYIPYPSPMLLLLLSLLPRAFRPSRIVADAVISLYDTVVVDRAITSKEGAGARVIRWLERRAYMNADAVIVDTPENALYYAQQFDMPAGRFHPIPLSTNEIDFAPRLSLRDGRGPTTVLFIGTLIPLHGIATILAAASLLRERSDICFRIVGDGQQGGLVEAATGPQVTNVQWVRTWQTSAQLAEMIADADICLGVFGDGEKAGRVCPYKLYAYSAVGRAVITAAGPWSRRVLAGRKQAPFIVVPPADPTRLAEEIVSLAGAPQMRISLGFAARAYYEDELSNARAAEALVALLRKESNESSR